MMQLQGTWFNQEGVRLFGSAMRAEDLLVRARVDIYREESGSSVGYQRNPERARARAFARYLHTQSIPLVPTAVLLNARDVFPRVTRTAQAMQTSQRTQTSG